MAHFMLRWRLAESSVKALIAHPHDRTERARALIEGFGGKLIGYYFALGEWDGVGICEFADTTTAVAVAMSATSTGAFSGWETTALLTAEEAEAAMHKAHNAKTSYRPPNV